MYLVHLNMNFIDIFINYIIGFGAKKALQSHIIPFGAFHFWKMLMRTRGILRDNR